MMKVKSFILAGLLAFAPAMAMNGQALAQNEAAAPVAATPVDADPKSSDPGAPADKLAGREQAIFSERDRKLTEARTRRAQRRQAERENSTAA